MKSENTNMFNPFETTNFNVSGYIIESYPTDRGHSYKVSSSADGWPVTTVERKEDRPGFRALNEGEKVILMGKAKTFLGIRIPRTTHYHSVFAAYPNRNL